MAERLAPRKRGQMNREPKFTRLASFFTAATISASRCTIFLTSRLLSILRSCESVANAGLPSTMPIGRRYPTHSPRTSHRRSAGRAASSRRRCGATSVRIRAAARNSFARPPLSDVAAAGSWTTWLLILRITERKRSPVSKSLSGPPIGRSGYNGKNSRCSGIGWRIRPRDCPARLLRRQTPPLVRTETRVN
jgi:hypothetical protein